MNIQDKQIFKKYIGLYLCANGNDLVERKEFDHTEERGTFAGMYSLEEEHEGDLFWSSEFSKRNRKPGHLMKVKWRQGFES